MWGAAPRPGRAKFALHPRHVLRTCPSETRRMRAHGLPPPGSPACGSTPPTCNQSAQSAVSYPGSPAGGSRPLIGFNRRNRRFPNLAVPRAVARP